MDVLLALLTILAYVLVSYLAGRLALALLVGEADGMIAASAPVVGAAGFALQLWLYGVIHVPWHIATLLLPWALLALLSRRAYGQALAADWLMLRGKRDERPRVDPLDILVLVLVVAIGAFCLLKLVTQPVVGPDAIAMWLYKAKFAYDHQAFDLRAMAAVPPGPTRHLDYPPLFPLMIATIYTLIGHVDDITAKAVNFLFLVSGVGTVYALLRSLGAQRAAALVAFILVAMPFFAMVLIDASAMGYADYALAMLLLMSLAYLYRFERGDGAMAAALALLFAGLAALTKNEGLVFLVIVAIVGGALLLPALRHHPLLNGDRRRLGAVVGLAVVPVLLWVLVTKSLGFSSDLLVARNWHALLPALPGRALTILRFARHTASLRNDYPFFAVGYLLSAFLILSNRVRPGRAILAVLSLQIAGYLVVYLLTPYDLNWHLATSFERVVLQVVPSVVLLTGIAATRPAF